MARLAKASRVGLTAARTGKPLNCHGTSLWTLDKSTAKQYLKAALNWRSHGVSFEMARDVFKDIFAIEWTDDRHGDAEERFITVGMVEGRLLFVAYTLRAERIRTISAREAEPRERRRYRNENET